MKLDGFDLIACVALVCFTAYKIAEQLLHGGG